MNIMFHIYSIDILLSLTEWTPDMPSTSPPLGSLWLVGTAWKGKSKDEAKNVDRDQIIQNLVSHEEVSALLRARGNCWENLKRGYYYEADFVIQARDANDLRKM